MTKRVRGQTSDPPLRCVRMPHDIAATASLRRAAASLPAEALASLYLGEALYRAGSREEGLSHLRRAASQRSPFVAIRRLAHDFVHL